MAVVSPEAPHRRVTDAGEPTNRELLNRLDDLTAEVRDLGRRMTLQEQGAILREEKLARAMPEIDLDHDFRIQVQTIARMTQWIFGASLLASIAAVASLVVTLSHIFQAGV